MEYKIARGRNENVLSGRGNISDGRGVDAFSPSSLKYKRLRVASVSCSVSENLQIKKINLETMARIVFGNYILKS